MPDGLRIGKAGRRVFTLPPDIATRATAVHGIRGSGKTVTASVIAEELLKLGSQVAIVDPTDAWWGLKSSLDGSKSGFPVVVLGGEHGDLPIEKEGGRAIADFAVEHRVPLVLSLRHLRKAGQRQFVKDFAEQVYHRKGATEYRTPLTIIIDEASTFIPQRVQGDVARLVGAIEDLVRRGRNSGIGVILIDQRPASVNKDVLTQAELLVSHRITGPHDRKALDEWIRQHDTEDRREAFLEDLASLPQGEAYFWAPGLDVFERVAVRMRETFDSSATPKPGEAPVAPQAFADVDLELLRAQLEETIAAAEENDPKALRARIGELEQELTDTQRALAAARDVAAEAYEQAHDECWSEEDLDREIHQAAKEAKEEAWYDAIDALTGAVAEVTENLSHRIADAIDKECPPLAPRPGRNGRGVLQKPARDSATPKAARNRSTAQAAVETNLARPLRSPSTTDEISVPQQRVLNAVATLEQLGEREPPPAQVAALAGYKPGGHFNNVKGSLRTTGLIDYPPGGGAVMLTDAGRAAARVAPISSIEDVHALWLSLATGPQRKLLDVVIDAYPDPISVEDLAERSGYSVGGHFNNVKGGLHTWGAIEYPHPGYVRASELLFPARLR